MQRGVRECARARRRTREQSRAWPVTGPRAPVCQRGGRTAGGPAGQRGAVPPLRTGPSRGPVSHRRRLLHPRPLPLRTPVPLHLTPHPPCDIPSGCCFWTGPWTVTRTSLRMLRRVAAFCRPLRPVLLLVSFPRLRSPVVGLGLGT